MIDPDAGRCQGCAFSLRKALNDENLPDWSNID